MLTWESDVLCLPLASQVKALGYDGHSPLSVPSWLDSLGLQDYIHSFLSSGYSSIDTVKNLWELELVNVSATWPVLRWPLAPLSLVPADLCPRFAGPEGPPAGPPQAHHCLPSGKAL